MNITMAADKLKEYGQEQVLRFFDEITAEEQQQLLNQIDNTDFDVIKVCREAGNIEQSRGTITPIPVMDTNEIDANRQQYTNVGVKAIKDGKVGAILLAGGMGTRLGSDGPKGVCDIGVTHPVYIFERLITNLMDTVNLTGAYIHLFVMTSEKNNDETISFFKEHAYFGYPEDYIHFFVQDMAPATDYEGKVLLETKSRMATSPNGNGGWYISLKKAGLDSVIRKAGIEWLNVFAVDNVLQRIADPCFVGATIDNKCVCGSKVIRKANRDEKVGVLCLENGHPSIVEYYELTKEMRDANDANGNPAYNFGVILNYLFRVDSLESIIDMKLPLHIVEKQITCIDNDGHIVSPDAPNGHKYESLILDMIKLLDSCLAYEVKREYEFAPIKNKTGVDSIESARELLRKNGIEL